MLFDKLKLVVEIFDLYSDVLRFQQRQNKTQMVLQSYHNREQLHQFCPTTTRTPCKEAQSCQLRIHPICYHMLLPNITEGFETEFIGDKRKSQDFPASVMNLLRFDISHLCHNRNTLTDNRQEKKFHCYFGDQNDLLQN